MKSFEEMLFKTGVVLALVALPGRTNCCDAALVIAGSGGVTGALSAVALAASEIRGNGCWYKWVIDPTDIKSFNLSFQFDPNVLEYFSTIPGTSLSGINYLNGYTQVSSPDLSQINTGLIKNIYGTHSDPPSGEVDIFEVFLRQKNTAIAGTITTGTTFAGSSDYLVALDRLTMTETFVFGADILPASDSITLTDCPESSSVAMMILSAGLLGFLRNRRNYLTFIANFKGKSQFKTCARRLLGKSKFAASLADVS